MSAAILTDAPRNYNQSNANFRRESTTDGVVQLLAGISLVVFAIFAGNKHRFVINWCVVVLPNIL
jgi:hypothetical protein